MDHYSAWIDDVDLINVQFKDVSETLIHNDYPYLWWEKGQQTFPIKVIQHTGHAHIQLRISTPLPLGETISLVWNGLTIPVYPRGIVRTRWFDEHYANPAATLGAVYSKEATTFTLWAPTALEVTLFVGTEKFKLNRLQKGIWSKQLDGDLNGKAYHYEVNVNGSTSRANDPYAKAMLANSERGVILDLSITDPHDFRQTAPPMIEDLKDSIIYELHVRDATIQKESGATHRGKFLGLTEDTTTPKGNSSGLNYIKELGVTHVQLLPINDFARVDELNPDEQYNWGYDPLFFQVPEGSYATDPSDPVVRIKEAKKMIQAFHKKDLAVILDVVYNHVFIVEESAFELIVPGYYFRYYEDGTLSNGTGVGNDFASERLMARKFILDTVDFWLSEYRVDGFRFDLMGITDIETMRAIQARADNAGKPIMLLGEGWDLPTALPYDQRATMNNASKLPDMRYFNDYFRDTLKGSSFQKGDQGFTNGQGRHNARLGSLMTGSAISQFGHTVFDQLNQTINFVEVHDNLTLWDQLKKSNPDHTEDERRKMHQLATGFMLLSQGIPFIHAGQEWFRTKFGDENSYISSDDVNQLDWKARDKEIENIKFVKSLIALRKKHDVFRLTSKDEVRDRFYVIDSPESVFACTFLGHRKDIVIYINPTNQTHAIQLPSSGKWDVEVANLPRRKHVLGEFCHVMPYEFAVMLKSR